MEAPSPPLAFRVDLHCHTGWGSGDSHTDPNVLVAQAKAFGLDGICITEHNQLWDQRKVEQLSDKHGFLVIGGIEVDTDVGHVLVYGLRAPRRFIRLPTIEELRRMVDEVGGAMVVAHPFRKRQKPPTAEFCSGVGLEFVERALELPFFDLVDGVEVQNGIAGPLERAFAGVVAGERCLPTTGGSDTHRHPEVGTTFTVFPGGIRNEQDLIDALKAGEVRGADWDAEGIPDRRHASILPRDYTGIAPG
ncbi:MAG: PHP domain-containing protein [Dehalococcoidia bacterium]|nr:PHP domain-containing protein [Dehalococcoidia bacterium]